MRAMLANITALLTQLWAVKLQTSLSVKSLAQLRLPHELRSTVVSVVKHYKYLHISPYVALHL